MSQASFSGFRGDRKEVLLTVNDISKAELSHLPLINCPFCTDHPQLVKNVSAQPHSLGAHFIKCQRCDRMLEQGKKCPFYKWLSVYAEYLLADKNYASNRLLLKIRALHRDKELQMNKEEAELFESPVTSPWNMNNQQGSMVPRINSAFEVTISPSQLREAKELVLKVLKVLRQLLVMGAVILAVLVVIALK